MMKPLGNYARLVALAVILTASFVGAQDEDLWEWEELGTVVYMAHCASCHGSAGEGVAGVYPALANNDFVTGEKALVISLILKGRGFMPAFRNVLGDEELAAVISYVRSSWGNEADMVNPSKVASLRESTDDGIEVAQVELAEGWYEEGKNVYRANCAACHQSEGQGIPGAFPALAGNSFVMSNPVPLIHVIVAGRGGMPSFSNLSDEQLAHVISYIRSSWENQASLVDTELVQMVRDRPPATPTSPFERPGAAN